MTVPDYPLESEIVTVPEIGLGSGFYNVFCPIKKTWRAILSHGVENAAHQFSESLGTGEGETLFVCYGHREYEDRLMWRVKCKRVLVFKFKTEYCKLVSCGWEDDQNEVMQ